LPPSHFILLFAILLILAYGVAFSVAGMVVFVFAFAFQQAGVDVVPAMFTRVSVTGSVFLVVYGVAAIRREGDEAKDLPNAIYPSPLRQLVFVSVARVSHWPFLAS